MKKSPVLLMMVAIVVIFIGCSKNDEPPMTPVQSMVTFTIKHVVDKEPLLFDTIRYTNAFGNRYSMSTLHYLVSDIRFKRTDGLEVRLDTVHYVDGRDESTLVFKAAPKIPSGNYSSVSFVFGLTNEKNVNGMFPNPPENNMEWPLPLGGGYHYMKLEGKFNHFGDIRNFQAHTGPTMGNDNSFPVTLSELGITLEGKDVTLTLIMDVNKWWENPYLLDLNEMTMVMGNQEMQQRLHDNGADVFSLQIR